MVKIREVPDEELIKRRENSRTLMATLAGLFFVWLIVIYYTKQVSLGYIGFVFLFLSILKYFDMRYYDLVIRMKENDDFNNGRRSVVNLKELREI